VDLRAPLRLLQLSSYQVKHADVPLIGHDKFNLAAVVEHRSPGHNDVLAVFQTLHDTDGHFLFDHFKGYGSIDKSLTDHILDIFSDHLFSNISIQSCGTLVQIDNVTVTIRDKQTVIGRFEDSVELPMHLSIDIKFRNDLLNFRHLSEEADRSDRLVLFNYRRNEPEDSDLFFFDPYPVDGRTAMDAGQQLLAQGRKKQPYRLSRSGPGRKVKKPSSDRVDIQDGSRGVHSDNAATERVEERLRVGSQFRALVKSIGHGFSCLRTRGKSDDLPL